MATSRWQDRIDTRSGGYAFLGHAAAFLFIGGFGFWATTMPLSGAAIAPSVIASAGRNIVIQHLEGGIVQQVLVQEGERIRVGDALIVLDPTSAETQLARLVRQAIALQAKAGRLIAERDGHERMDASEAVEFIARGRQYHDVVTEQEKEFTARLTRFRAELEIMAQRLAGLEEVRKGLLARQEAVRTQLGIVQEEGGFKKQLLDKGLLIRSEYSGLLRSEAELVGLVGQIASELGANAVRVVEAREQVERLQTTRVEEAVAELNGVRSQLADIEEQLVAADAVLKRTKVISPVDGIVLKMQVNTPGGVIESGAPVLEILPTTSEPIIEAKLSPQDVDDVEVGQSAKLRFTSLNARITPEVNGLVTYVSADRFIDEGNGIPYFIARLKITDDLPPEVRPDQIVPGMSVETYISTGERTFAEYIIRPILDSTSRAFREE